MTSRQLSQKLDLVMKRVSTANVTFGRSGLLAKKCDDIQWFTKSEFFRTSQVLSHNPQRDCCKYLLRRFYSFESKSLNFRNTFFRCYLVNTRQNEAIFR